MLGVGRGLWDRGGAVGGVVHGGGHLGGGLAVDGSSMLVMLWRLDRGGRVGLWGVIDGGVARAIHGRGRHEFGRFRGRVIGGCRVGGVGTWVVLRVVGNVVRGLRWLWRWVMLMLLLLLLLLVGM